MPDRETIMAELGRHGLHYEQTVHIHNAFCPKGHQLILDANAKFDGLPGVKLLMRDKKRKEIVFISPVLNNRQRTGGSMFVVGDRLEVLCPVCEVAMPVLAPCDCQWNGEYVMLSLGENPARKHAVCICTVWGCPNGDIRLAGEVVTNYQSNYAL